MACGSVVSGEGMSWPFVAHLASTAQSTFAGIDTDTEPMGESLRSPATVVARQAVPVRSSAVEVDCIRFAWEEHGSDVLDIARFAVAVGERVFVEGPSGSGKSTLLSLIGGVLRPRDGTVRVLGTSISAMPARLRDRFRADHIGFIFQMFNLVPYLSVIDNVTLPCRFSRRRRERAEIRSGTPDAEAHRLLGLLGLDRVELLGRVVTDLSIGQQQRVAAARALIGGPELIIADEPTSALDEGTRERFLGLLYAQCGEAGASLVFASHDTRLGGLFDRRVSLADLQDGGSGQVG